VMLPLTPTLYPLGGEGFFGSPGGSPSSDVAPHPYPLPLIGGEGFFSSPGGSPSKSQHRLALSICGRL
jgi:hypothetical protein